MAKLEATFFNSSTLLLESSLNMPCHYLYVYCIDQQKHIYFESDAIRISKCIIFSGTPGISLRRCYSVDKYDMATHTLIWYSFNKISYEMKTRLRSSLIHTCCLVTIRNHIICVLCSNPVEIQNVG